MPLQVTPWETGNPITAKSLNLALYSCDGTQDNPNGIGFQAQRPVLLENYTHALAINTSVAGTRTSLTTSGTVASCQVVMDSAGYFGQTSDLPGAGYYRYAPIIAGSSGDGVSAGGWTILAHFAAITTQTTQTSVGADLLENGTFSRGGTRFPASTSRDSTPFYLDLRNAGVNTWNPAVIVDDSSSTQTTMHVNSTDISGEASKFCAIWAGVSAAAEGSAFYSVNGTYNFTCPTGVTEVTAQSTGAGGGGGAGQGDFGGGGGGGGEWAQNTAVGTTPGHDYTVVVGAGGTAGAQPGGSGGVGGSSSFAGDTQTVTGNGGQAGTGATALADGTGGDGGSGSTAPSHNPGGDGASGSTGAYGGGGGSSASSAGDGNNATGPSGASAPSGGGPGGAGGADQIAIVQYASGGSSGGASSYSVSFDSPVQAGNTVIVAVNAVGTGTPGANGRVSAVVLNDGTVLTARVTEQLSGAPNASWCYIWDAGGVAGGEDSVQITYGGSANRISLAYIYEVSGLGPTITEDTSTSGSGKATTYSSGSTTTTDAPELWIGVCGWQGTDPVGIYASGSPWTQQAQLSDGQGSGGNNLALRPAYSLAAATGKLTYGGNLSDDTASVTIAVAYETSTSTAGDTPVAGPGGGGGGGLGAFDGGAGFDGSVALTWTGQAGSAYGTPALPAPVSAWTSTSEITSAILNGNTGIADVCNFLNNPPLLSVFTSSAQSIPNTTATAITQFGTSTDIDNYAGWSSNSNTYTVQRAGLYLFHGLVCFATNGTGERLAGAKINGTVYWGPGYTTSSVDKVHCSKTQVFGLHAGDTVQLACWQNSGGALNTDTADKTRFFLAWLGELGAPAATWTPPDPGFRWQSGTAGSAMPGLLQEHLANDLGFLVNRPYLLAYQTSTQSSLAASAFHTVTLDTVGSILHAGDSGDNYAGWTSGASNNYAAPVAGWYMVCGEDFTTAPSSGSIIGAILPTTSGGYSPSTTPDWYQNMVASTSSSAVPGATVFGLVYMEAGEAITPQVNGNSYSGSFGTTVGTVSGGQVNSHLSVIWMSE